MPVGIYRAGTYRPGRLLSLLVTAQLAAGIAGAFALQRHPVALQQHLDGSARVQDSAATTRDAFLVRYMDPGGRIVRRDQGGDTVSEGQAYAMLIAAADGDSTDFQKVWSWTESHLARPDRLLAWHWQDGRVVDGMPASDADLDSAWALAVAATRFHSPALAADAGDIAKSILSEETVATSAGPVLVAGPWAQPSGTIEPGYAAPEAFAVLERLTGDGRWSRLEATAVRVITEATSSNRWLPADWLSVNNEGVAVPVAPPSSPADKPSYGLDAARLAPWWAASCSASDRYIAAGEWSLLSPTANAGDFRLSLTLDGRPRVTAVNATMAVADAFSAAAAGHAREARSLLSAASRLDGAYPTYYGSAWVSIGRLLSSSTVIGNCPLTF